jgi:type I restriction enzyme M protein
VARAVKDLGKLQEERDTREQEVRLAAKREITHLREASADLLRICSSEDEARRYFTLVGREEIAENEFNLNLPRYVDTFEPEKVLLLDDAAAQLKSSTEAAVTAQAKLVDLLRAIGQENVR